MQTKSIIQAAAISSFLLIVAMLLNLWNIESIRNQNARADLAELAIYDIWNAFASLKEAQTAEREYLLLGDETQLATFEKSVSNIRYNLRDLQDRLGEAESEFSEQLDLLQAAMEEKVQILRTAIQTRRTFGISAAAEAMRTDRGEQAMEKIRAIVFKLIAEQRKVVEQQLVTTENTYEFATWAGLLSGLCALFCLIALTVLVKKFLREREAAHEEAVAKTRLLETTLSAIADGVVTTDGNGCIYNINTKAESLCGTTAAEAVGKPIGSVLQTQNEDGQPIDIVAECLSLGHSCEYSKETYLLRADANSVRVDAFAAPFLDMHGHLLGCVLTFRDISDQIAREDALRKSEIRYRATFDNAAVGISHTLLDGRMIRINDRFAEILGYSKQEMLRMNFRDITHPEDIASNLVEIKKVSSGQIPYHSLHKRYIKKNGDTIWAHLTFSVVRESNGEEDYFLTIIEDITDRIIAQNALQENKTLLQDILDNTFAFMCVLSTEGKLVAANKTALEWADYTPEQCIGESFDKLYWWEHDKKTAARLNTVISEAAAGDIVRYDEHIRAGNDEIKDIDLIITPSKNRSGTVKQLIVTAIDISERKRLEKKLQDVVDELALSNQRKDEFLATLSHELRNPMAPIRTGLDVIKEISDNPALFEETRSMMVRQTRHLTSLIDDLLDVSRISRGILALREKPVPLHEVVQQAIETVKPQIDEAQHTLNTSLPSVQITLTCDPNRLAQVIANLLTNAVRYTPSPGKIDLAVTYDNQQITISVTDNGIGIPKEKLEFVFELFGQVRSGEAQVNNGLGIGLTLARDLVRKHGGELTAHSEGVDQGSEFKIQLPISKATMETPVINTEPQTEKRTKRCIVIADDSPAILKTIGMLFRLKGHEVHTAEDGGEAIAVIEKVLPDIAFLDLGMPQVSGYDAAKAVRQLENGKSVRLVALTGWGGPEASEKVKESGFDQHIVKPPEPEDLLRIIDEL